ncbi:MAG: DapH/DapD/GlmU-related protein [Bacteroidota bacterium]
MNKIIDITTILEIIKEYRIVGSIENLSVTNVKPIDDANQNSIVWLKPGKSDGAEIIARTKANVIICHINDVVKDSPKTFICVEDPKLVFTGILSLFLVEDTKWGIHPSAIIDKEAQINEMVSIGPYCIIGKAVIGSNSIIKGHCVIGDNVTIGDNVIIHPFSMIGSDGFGFVRNEDGKLEKFHHLGSVYIEDSVEIYPYVNVDRGALGETRIKKGAKIDHYCHIGHNSTVGNDTLITAATVLCGGARVGDRSWIGVNSTIKEKVEVGDDVTIGIGSVVTKNVPNSETWLGSPATKMEEFLAIQKKLKKIMP